jgi:hypothetical protein
MATPPYARAQDLTLLTTKLYIPPPLPNLVERPRLVKRLDEGLRLGHRLIPISAPAGFGKTTLLSEWIHQQAGEPKGRGAEFLNQVMGLDLSEEDIAALETRTEGKTTKPGSLKVELLYKM